MISLARSESQTSSLDTGGILESQTLSCLLLHVPSKLCKFPTPKCHEFQILGVARDPKIQHKLSQAKWGFTGACNWEVQECFRYSWIQGIKYPPFLVGFFSILASLSSMWPTPWMLDNPGRVSHPHFQQKFQGGL